MKLFHATQSENIEDILTNGLMPVTDEESNCNRVIKECGIYGFTELKHALGFAKDQCWDNVSVVSFEADIIGATLDPEYCGCDDYGTAYFIETEENITECELVL